jgi:cysteine-rich repeat protein
MDCIDKPKLISSTKKGSTVISFIFSPFKCLNENQTLVKIATSLLKLNCTLVLTVSPPAPLKIMYIEPSISIHSGNPITVTITHDGCNCELPWCKDSQNLILSGESKYFEFIPNTFGPIFASIIVPKDKLFTATFNIPASVEPDEYIFTTKKGLCSASVTYLIQKIAIPPSISRILPRHVSVLGGETVRMYVDHAVGESKFVLFIQRVQVQIVILKSELLKGQFILEFISPPSEELGAADIQLTLVDSGSITLSSPEQLFYESPPVKVEPDTLLSETPNNVTVTLLHPKSSILPQLRLYCSNNESFALHTESLSINIQNFDHTRTTFSVYSLNTGQQICMLISSLGLKWPVRFDVFAKPALVTINYYYVNTSSTALYFIKMIVKNFPFLRSSEELTAYSEENSRLALSYRAFSRNEIQIDAVVPKTSYITLRHTFLDRIFMRVMIKTNDQPPLHVKVLKQNYIPDFNQDSAQLQLVVLSNNCAAKIVSDIEITSINASIMISSVNFGQLDTQVISFSVFGLLPGERSIKLSCSRQLVDFKVYINNPERQITCPDENGCVVSNLASELMFEMSGFPKLSLGFLPQIYFPQRTVTVASFTEYSLVLEFAESDAPSASGFGSSIHHIHFIFESLRLNQTATLEVLHTPEVNSSEIDASGMGMKIRFNQAISGEIERCDAYFDSKTVSSFGIPHFCNLQDDFLQVTFGLGATFTSGKVFFDGSSVKSKSALLSFQNPKRNILVLNPLILTPITVSLVGPSNVGACDTAMLHTVVSSSRPESLQFIWSSPSNDILSLYLDQSKGSTIALLPHMFPRTDSLYKIVVRVRNFLGAYGTSASHEIFFESIPAPQLRVINPSYGRVFHVWEEISVVVALTKSSCVMKDMGELAFQWKVHSSQNITNLPLQARLSESNSPVIVIPSYFLQPETSTHLELNVVTPNLKTSRTFIFINTTASEFVILMSDFQPQTSVQDAFVLNSSPSHDPDDPPNTKSSINFEWNCKQGAFACIDAKSNIMPSYSGAVVFFPPNSLLANSTYTFILTMHNSRKMATKYFEVSVVDQFYNKETWRYFSLGTFFDENSGKVNLGNKFQIILETLEPITSASIEISPGLTGFNALVGQQLARRTHFLYIWNYDASSMMPFALYYFKCTFRTMSDQKVASMSLIVNSGPTGGNCRTFYDGSFDTLSVRAFDEVEISCSSFFDQDLPITYKHSYLVNDAFFEYYRGYKSAAKMPVLPGDVFVWKVELFDKYGSAGSPVSGQLAVLPSLTNLDEEMSAALNSKNVGVALVYVSSFAIISSGTYSGNNASGKKDTEFVIRTKSSASNTTEFCPLCLCEYCDIFKKAVDLVGSMSAGFSVDQILNSLLVFNGALGSSKLRNGLNSTTTLETVNLISLMLGKLLVNSNLKLLKYQDVSLISSTIASISECVADRVLSLAFNETVALLGLVLPKFIHAFSDSLLPRLDDTYILNSQIKISISKRFQTGKQLAIASSSMDELPRVILDATPSTIFDGSETAVLMSYGLAAKVLPTLGTLYTTAVDFTVHRSNATPNTTVLTYFLIDEANLQFLRSQKLLSNSLLRDKSRVQAWDFTERKWKLEQSCVILDADLYKSGTVIAKCPLSSTSPKAVSYNADMPICGDGITTGSETCDDNNLADADGCDRQCQVERGWKCEQNSPSRCELLSTFSVHLHN